MEELLKKCRMGIKMYPLKPVVGETLVDILMDKKIVKYKVIGRPGIGQIAVASTIEEYFQHKAKTSLDNAVYMNGNLYLGRYFLEDFMTRQVRPLFNGFNSSSVRRLIIYHKKGFKIVPTSSVLQTLLLKDRLENAYVKR